MIVIGNKSESSVTVGLFLAWIVIGNKSESWDVHCRVVSMDCYWLIS